MLIYYAILVVLALSLLVTAARARDADLLVLALGVALTVTVAGLRWRAEVDGEGYADLYDETPRLTSFSADSIHGLYGEPGYLLASAALKSAGLEFYVFTFLCAAFALGAKAYLAARFTRGASLAFSIYLCSNFVTTEFIQVRWAVASALVVAAQAG